MEDFANPVETATDTSLSRTLTIVGRAEEGTYLRLAAGDIQQQGDAFRLGDLTIRMPAAYEPQLRTVPGGRELLVPLHDDKTERSLLLDYAW